MFKKVNWREKIVGWYHTGPKLHPNDVDIDEKIKKLAANAVLVVIDPQHSDSKHPTEAYMAVSEVHDDGTPTTTTFSHVPSETGSEEVEEVGVEHLLRDINKLHAGSVNDGITSQLNGLRGLRHQLETIINYLHEVERNEMPINHQVNYQLQEILQMLPDVTTSDMQTTLNMQMSDDLLAIFMASVIRAVLAQHHMISNKLSLAEYDKVSPRPAKKRG